MVVNGLKAQGDFTYMEIIYDVTLKLGFILQSILNTFNASLPSLPHLHSNIFFSQRPFIIPLIARSPLNEYNASSLLDLISASPAVFVTRLHSSRQERVELNSLAR